MSIVPVNTTTGEIARDPQSVVDFLENAKWMLDAAVEMTGPAEVANVKAQVVMADTYARELHLSKDIQDQSREMVRRAEYAMNRAIRQAQERGEIATSSEAKSHAGKVRQLGTDYAELNPPKPTPANYLERHEWNNTNGGISDLDATNEEFEKALEDAKAEGNISRANVIRKIKGKSSPDAPLTRQQRADLIADLAEQGLSSRQMPTRVGVTERHVRQIARDFGVEIPADRVVGRTRRIDHTDVVEKTVTDLENAVEFIEAHIDLNEVDFTEADEWVSSLSKSISALTRFRNQIKEQTHV